MILGSNVTLTFDFSFLGRVNENFLKNCNLRNFVTEKKSIFEMIFGPKVTLTFDFPFWGRIIAFFLWVLIFLSDFDFMVELLRSSSKKIGIFEILTKKKDFGMVFGSKATLIFISQFLGRVITIFSEFQIFDRIPSFIEEKISNFRDFSTELSIRMFRATAWIFSEFFGRKNAMKNELTWKTQCTYVFDFFVEHFEEVQLTGGNLTETKKKSIFKNKNIVELKKHETRFASRAKDGGTISL